MLGFSNKPIFSDFTVGVYYVNTYPLVNYHSWLEGPSIQQEIYLQMVHFHPAMLVYRNVVSFFVGGLGG